MKELPHTNKSITIGWLICALGAFFYCYQYLLRIEPSVMLPELMQNFHVTAKSLGFLIAIYYYIYSPLQILVGVIVDRYGPRKVLTVAISLCALGSFLFGFNHGLALAAAGRLLIGFGSAFAFVGVLKLAAVWLPKHHFALFAGLATSLGMVGAMAGDMELTRLTARIGWEATVHLGTLIGAGLIPLIWFIVRDQRYKSVGKKYGNTNFKLTLLGFVKVIKNPQIWISGIIGCFMYLALSVFAELWGIPFLRDGYHYSPEKAGFAVSMVFFGWLLGAPVMGWVSDRIYTRKLPMIIASFTAAFLFIIVLYGHVPPELNNILLFIFGVCTSVQVICFAISREHNPTKIAGTAVAFTNTLIMLSGVLFQPLVGWLLDEVSYMDNFFAGQAAYSLFDYQIALNIIPVCLVIAGLLGFALRDVGKHGDLDEFDIENGIS